MKKIRRRRKVIPHNFSSSVSDEAILLTMGGGNVSSVQRLLKLDLEPVPKGQETTNLIRELLRMGRDKILKDILGGVTVIDHCNYMDESIRPRAREIGERLWEITKDSDPGFFRWFAQCDMLSLPPAAQTELSHVWDGIGDWRD